VKVAEVFLIKDLARISGHSIDTLKFYLKMELIKEVGRSQETNFRFFNNNTLRRLRLIRQMRLQGMTLKQIKNHLS
jgi:DNA-binding transcriptional MerR regulator